LDQIEIFDAVKNTGGILTVEEHTVEGGLGGAVAETCLDNGTIPRCFKRIGLREGFSSIAGTQEYLRQQFGMDEASIVSAAQKLLIKNSKKSDADSLKDEKVI
jgi:transketolase